VSTLVVTGAAGYLGSALVRQLTEQLPGVRIRAQIRQTPLSPAALQHANMHVLQGELTDPDFCEALCNGADQVIHLAGYAHTVGSRNTQLALNLNMTNTLVKAAVAMGVRDLPISAVSRRLHRNSLPMPRLNTGRRLCCWTIMPERLWRLPVCAPPLCTGPG